MKVDKSKWVETAFAKIATSQLGKTLDANKNKGLPYPYLCAANVGMGYFNLSNVKEILLEDSELEKYLVRKGDLLICEGGDTGRCSIWESEHPIYYQNALHRVRFNEDTHNKFIMYYLHYYKKVGVIDRLSHGQTIKHFTQKGLNKLSFKLPSLAIQQSIAKELDSIQEMIDGYKAQIADLTNLTESIFLDMFGDPITNPKGWEIKQFTEIATSQLGKTLDANKNKGLAYPYLCAANVGMGYFNLSNIKEILLEDSELEKYLVRKGDLLICEGGDTGRCAIWESDEPIYYQNALHRVRITNGTYNKYIMLIIHHYKKYGIIKKLSHGQTIQHFTQKGLNQLTFPIPPLSLQVQFAVQVEAIEAQKKLLREQLIDAETLMAERMQYYFS